MIAKKFGLTEDDKISYMSVFNPSRFENNFNNYQIFILLQNIQKIHTLSIDQNSPDRMIIIDEQNRKYADLKDSDIELFEGKFVCDPDKLKNEFIDSSKDTGKVLEEYIFDFLSELYEMDIEVLKKGWNG